MNGTVSRGSAENTGILIDERKTKQTTLDDTILDRVNKI